MSSYNLRRTWARTTTTVPETQSGLVSKDEGESFERTLGTDIPLQPGQETGIQTDRGLTSRPHRRSMSDIARRPSETSSNGTFDYLFKDGEVLGPPVEVSHTENAPETAVPTASQKPMNP